MVKSIWGTVLAYLHIILESKVHASGKKFYCIVKELFHEKYRWGEATRGTFENLQLQQR